MNQIIKRLLLASCVALALLTSVYAFDSEAPVVLLVENLVFEPLNLMIAMAGAWGDCATGQHRIFGTF